MLVNATKPSLQDEEFQNHILKGVSRTFALTIPQLPPELTRVVSNAYLLCRIADTIEDDKDMSVNHKREFSEFFVGIVSGHGSASDFAKNLTPLLSNATSSHEKSLVNNSSAVIRITHSLNQRQHEALTRCVRIMTSGMSRYQGSDIQNGLCTQKDMDDYCYHVAGVVGEMLTELFCDYSDEIDQHYDTLMDLSVSFGQGLQMTNILKDIWDDKARNMCWLPQEVFDLYGADLSILSQENISDGTKQSIGHLVGVARAHLENALKYSLIIPKYETGIRHFCLWAIGMAILTLRNINNHRDFTSGQQVKISRFNVKTVIMATNLLTKNDKMLTKLFNIYAKDLPNLTEPIKADSSP
ncbi:MAG: phytoene/squalene synthase family protein [Gammaproteobacteria bacterium]|jgi:farnesyl-diphosphate farnesyltransferase